MKQTETIDLWSIERDRYARGFQRICGIDEAGRGPLAGPVCAAAVILPPDMRIDGLNDSKKLTDKKRRALYDVIVEEAFAYGIAFSDEKEIDTVNILQATFLAMQRAYANCGLSADCILVDGNRLPKLPVYAEAIVGGDAKSANIAAASILAKVTRDRYMEQQAEIYPGYGFEIHKGYGTKLHYEAIDKLGPCEMHRISFLKKYFERKGVSN